MTNYFNDKGECIDCEGLAKHCRETGQVFPLNYREASPDETLSEICNPSPIIYIQSRGVDSTAFGFDTKKNTWVEEDDLALTVAAYCGIDTPLNRNKQD